MILKSKNVYREMKTRIYETVFTPITLYGYELLGIERNNVKRIKSRNRIYKISFG